MEQNLCKYCHFPLEEKFYFCPNCGKKIKEPPVTLMQQIGVYALSIFLPPLGLWPGVKYLSQKDQKTRIIGIIAIILTIISTVVTAWLFIGFMNEVNIQINKQLSQPLY